MIVIAPTNRDWFDLLRVNSTDTALANFWTTTPWKFKSLAPGEFFYFLLKAPIRKIAGYGAFASYEELTVEEAWLKFGVGNGTRSLEEFEHRRTGFRYTRQEEVTPIGCILLRNCTFLDEGEWFRPEDRNVSFAGSIVKFKAVDVRSIHESGSCQGSCR